MDIISALKKITEPCILGVYLRIEYHELKKIEKEYPHQIKRQMIEVINYWLHDNSDCNGEL